MIPKRAIFFYEGEPMSWLRQQSLETFKACNPDWEVVVINGDNIPIEKNGLLSIVHRSDWARYQELHRNGGFYFDTDIVFYAPIPHEWVNSEIVLPMVTRDDLQVAHIATMGCAPGDAFFADASEICRKAVEQHRFLNYQALGVLTLNKCKTLLSNRNVHWVSADSLLPIPWDQTERLWNPYFGPLPPLSCGVHWFGGDHLSRAVDEMADEEWLRESSCIVARAITQAREQCLTHS